MTAPERKYSEERRLRVISVVEADFCRSEDGYLGWWPDKKGYLGAADLRIIADELDRRNAEWDAKIRDYFSIPPNDAA